LAQILSQVFVEQLPINGAFRRILSQTLSSFFLIVYSALIVRRSSGGFRGCSRIFLSAFEASGFRPEKKKRKVKRKGFSKEKLFFAV